MSFDTRWKEMHDSKYENSVVRTQLSFFGNDTNPGFLTPWCDNASFLNAIEELCDNVFSNIYLVVGSLSVVVLLPVVRTFFEADNESDPLDKDDWLAHLVAVPYYAVSFVVDLVVNLTAMVTRTLTTVCAAAVGVFSECCFSEEYSGSNLDDEDNYSSVPYEFTIGPSIYL